MGVEHVPGGDGAAYAFLQLDGFRMFAFLRFFHVFPSFLSCSLRHTILSLPVIQFATEFLIWTM